MEPDAIRTPPPVYPDGLKPEFIVFFEELHDGRYVAWAEFPRAAMSQRSENLITPVDECRSVGAVYQAAGDLAIDAGYVTCQIVQKRRPAA